jgi:cytochrome subunit of sulfide dehydrogenase
LKALSVALAVAALGLALASTPSKAQQPRSFTEAELRQAAYLAANCANCHGTAGNSPGSMPGLAGLARNYFVRQMQDFRDGRRQATVMHQLAKGYTDEQFEAMAEYFSRQKTK